MLGYLRVESGPDEGRIFNFLDGITLVLGRSQKTDTQLKDFSVSRFHCEVQAADGRLTLRDREGSSGAFVNGKKVAEQVLKSGDTIRIGETEIKVHLAGIADAETITAAQKAARHAPGGGHRPHRPVHRPLRGGAGRREGEHRDGLQGEGHPRRQARRPEDPPPGLRRRRGGRPALRPRDAHSGGPEAPEPRRAPGRRQARRPLLDRHGVRRGGEPGQRDQADRRCGDDQVDLRAPRGRAGRPGAGGRAPAPGRPPEHLAQEHPGDPGQSSGGEAGRFDARQGAPGGQGEGDHPAGRARRRHHLHVPRADPRGRPGRTPARTSTPWERRSTSCSPADRRSTPARWWRP